MVCGVVELPGRAHRPPEGGPGGLGKRRRPGHRASWKLRPSDANCRARASSAATRCRACRAAACRAAARRAAARRAAAQCGGCRRAATSDAARRQRACQRRSRSRPRKVHGAASGTTQRSEERPGTVCSRTPSGPRPSRRSALCKEARRRARQANADRKRRRARLDGDGAADHAHARPASRNERRADPGLTGSPSPASAVERCVDRQRHAVGRGPQRGRWLGPHTRVR
jgi:hypothetical protein